ncbi:hypothetical protein GCM10010404_41390 [Nonomuraea africana]|uniref:Uncharacterized membrane protein YhaH (DUF805 family) n=1 Tax=Nonomuraea africana TaxID=46171 RepID=A0ABR9KUP4_9ACTN|nr:hypothetical protein [Nonomuraea africana]MBE1565720.1 uncharacterized membrane protein YhaH (DUF805 family) [Nonomuraea africana]
MTLAWPDHSRRPSAGRVLAVATVLPALAVAAWLLAGLPLLLAGWFKPFPVTVLAGAVLVVLGKVALTRMPDLDATARQVGGVFGVALLSLVGNAILHSEQLIVRRDPATYAQYAIWIARNGSLPVPQQAEAFGGADPALRFDSIGFYDAPGAVVPQFLPGPPMLFAAGEWLGGLLFTPPVLGALATLVLAGAVARLVGARWAVLAALAFAISLPILYTSRATFSEIPSLILIFGGIALLHDARGRWDSALAGLVFGLAVLVRIDALRDVLPVLAFAGLLIALRRGFSLLAGLAVGVGLGLVAARTFAGPYLADLSNSVRPLLLISVAVLVLTAVGTALAGRLSRLRPPRWLPEVGAGLVVLVMLGLAVRPWVQTVRRTPNTPGDWRTFEFLVATQKNNGLPIDGTRLYFEDSLYWVIWYVGVPVVVFATLAAAVLVRRLRDGSSFEWLLPLAIIGWTTVTTLLRPEITPDHPWASRRLVPVVIPGLIMLAVWGLAWCRDRLGRRGHGTRWFGAAAVVLVLAPVAVTSIGIAFTPIERGERAAVERLCESIPSDASVLIVERVTADRFSQVVRGTCGVPTAQVRRSSADTPSPVAVRRLIEKIRKAGRAPVLLAAESGQLTPYGTPRHVVALDTRQDERSLVAPPDGAWRLVVNVWMTRPA